MGCCSTQVEGRLTAVLSTITSLLGHRTLGCFGGVWQLQVWCEQRGSSLVSPREQSMPAGCAVLMRRSRAPSRTHSGPAACDVSGVLGVTRGAGVTLLE